MPIEVSCPLCSTSVTSLWAIENGYSARRCKDCGLIYVSPRPSDDEISEANKVGVHKGAEGTEIDVRFGHSNGKIRRFGRVVRTNFPELARSERPVAWLDVGAGYGELVEALLAFLPDRSRVLGIEPMIPKVEGARRRNLPVASTDLAALSERFDVISMMDIFSHVPDFRGFIRQLRPLLNATGEIFLETGNGADLPSAKMYPDLLYLPDHLVFGGISHLRKFFETEGFRIVSVRTERVDTAEIFAKSIVKRLLGRKPNAPLLPPYSSAFRKVFLRARLVS